MGFSIHDIQKQLFKVWRAKRHQWFVENLRPSRRERLLDVGGYPGTWTQQEALVAQVDCLNIHEVEWNTASHPEHHITTLIGDGRDLPFPDGNYDIGYSNSVIEHVGQWEDQQRFAAELRRVSKRLWVQTPAYECPIEPHYLAPFVHWLPKRWRRFTIKWLTPWSWIQKPDEEEIDLMVDTTRLISKREFQDLFPDCEILTERLAGFLPKSYIAIRRA